MDSDCGVTIKKPVLLVYSLDPNGIELIELLREPGFK